MIANSETGESQALERPDGQPIAEQAFRAPVYQELPTKAGEQDLDLEKVKPQIQAKWLSGRGEWPVKVIAAGQPASDRVGGYFTQAKYVLGQTPEELEHRLGLPAGELREGAIIQELSSIPRVEEFNLRGYTNTPGGQSYEAGGKYPPGSGIPQWQLREGVTVRANVIGEVGPGQPFRMEPGRQLKTGAGALNRVRGFVSPDLNLMPMTAGERAVLSYNADSCRALADILDRQGGHIARTMQPDAPSQLHDTSQYTPHFQGDLNEVVTHKQYEGWGAAALLNDADTGHGNHPHTDLRFESASGATAFAGDIKVSLGKNPNHYYLPKLDHFDALVADGTITPAEANLFVPHDHVVPLKEAIDARFQSLADKHPDQRDDLAQQAETWKSRVHESGLSSRHYRQIIEHCTDQTTANRVSLDRIYGLADDLQTASIYLKTFPSY
jgi:hypothetical protein